MERGEINSIFQKYKTEIEGAVKNRTTPFDTLNEFELLDDSKITEEDRRKAGPCDLGIVSVTSFL